MCGNKKKILNQTKLAFFQVPNFLFIHYLLGEASTGCDFCLCGPVPPFHGWRPTERASLEKRQKGLATKVMLFLDTTVL